MGEHLPEHGSASSCNHFGAHSDWKIYLATKLWTKVANWKLTIKKKKKKGKMWKIYQSLDELPMNYSVYDTLIMKYETLSFHGYNSGKSYIQ